MPSSSNYLVRVGSATSQLANVIFLGGGPNESISGRAYRNGWHSARYIDLLFGEGHCKSSYAQDATDAFRYLTEFDQHDANRSS